MLVQVRTLVFVMVIFIFAMMAEVIALPVWSVPLRPQLVLLVLLYWELTNPYRTNLFLVFLLGLLLDVLHNVILGEHALVLLVISYFVLKFHHRIQMFNLARQILVVLVLLISYQLMLFILGWLLDYNTLAVGWRDFGGQQHWRYGSGLFISALIWPGLIALLDGLRNYFKV